MVAITMEWIKVNILHTLNLESRQKMMLLIPYQQNSGRLDCSLYGGLLVNLSPFCFHDIFYVTVWRSDFNFSVKVHNDVLKIKFEYFYF